MKSTWLVRPYVIKLLPPSDGKQENAEAESERRCLNGTGERLETDGRRSSI